MPQSTAVREIIVVNPQGFHARPAHLFMKLAGEFQAEVRILKGNHAINGKSILDLLTLGAGNGTKLTLEAIGNDAQAAVDALAQLVQSGFGEMEGALPPNGSGG
ncbi:MAG: HPr family phosphocarrier protein [Pirellulaceae bacterium]